MKNLPSLFIALSLALASVTFADEDQVHILAQNEINNQYLGSNGDVFYTSPTDVIFTNVSRGDWNGGFWLSTALGGEGWWRTYGDELDLYASVGHTFDWYRIDLTGWYFIMKEPGRLTDDYYLITDKLSFPKVPVVQPYVTLQYLGVTSSKTSGAGWALVSGIQRAQPLEFKFGDHTILKTIPLEFTSGFSFGYAGKPTGFMFNRLSGSVPLSLSEHWSLIPSVIWQLPGVDNETWTGAIVLRWAK